ncbi:hypothetical protein [Serratia ureilytica]|uniref:hypothetical protein n=1 Tax=Serratia ureilytica TaxID=300181 RepID=UPI0034C69586
MDNKQLQNISKPVAYVFNHGVMGPGDFKYGTPQMHSTAKDENASPLYSQEYVSAMLADLEAKDERVAELEAKLAKPLRLTEERTLWAGEDDYDTGHVKGWNANRIEQAALLKKQGFTVKGDEQ